jgi:hypothetical protein
MTFNAEENYEPYGGSPACNGVSAGENSPCNLKPSNVAKECQRIASKTLKAIMETENEAMTLLKEIELKYSTPSDGFIPFGWLNDAYSDRSYGATNAPQALFIWRSNKPNVRPGSCPRDFKSVSIEDYAYIKWVSSVSATGECRSPSLGQFKALLKAAKKCLEDNNAEGN